MYNTIQEPLARLTQITVRLLTFLILRVTGVISVMDLLIRRVFTGVVAGCICSSLPTVAARKHDKYPLTQTDAGATLNIRTQSACTYMGYEQYRKHIAFQNFGKLKILI